jgi:hypothetical protein
MKLSDFASEAHVKRFSEDESMFGVVFRDSSGRFTTGPFTSYRVTRYASVPTGETYKRGLKKGMPKTRRVKVTSEWIENPYPEYPLREARASVRSTVLFETLRKKEGHLQFRDRSGRFTKGEFSSFRTVESVRETTGVYKRGPRKGTPKVVRKNVYGKWTDNPYFDRPAEKAKELLEARLFSADEIPMTARPERLRTRKEGGQQYNYIVNIAGRNEQTHNRSMRTFTYGSSRPLTYSQLIEGVIRVVTKATVAGTDALEIDLDSFFIYDAYYNEKAV